MAFANGYHGDDKALGYILQTLAAKTILIPGVTINPNLSMSVDGENAYYYTRSATTVATGTVGGSHSYTSGGGTKVSIAMTTCVKIDSVIPNANFATVSADIVNDRIVYETLGAANKLNVLGEAALEATTNSFTGTTAATYSTIYGIIIDARKEWIAANVATGLKPTAIIVGPTVEALLLKSTEFIHASSLGDNTLVEGVIGKIAGMYVVVAEDMDETTNKVDFIMLNAEGFAAPTNVNVLSVGDATQAGYPGGTLIAGEIGYGFKITLASLVYKRVHA